MITPRHRASHKKAGEPLRLPFPFIAFLLALPLAAHAQMYFNLGGTYVLEAYHAAGDEITISFSGIKNVPLCTSKGDREQRIDMLNQALAGSRNIEIHSNAGSSCISDIDATPSKAERMALVEGALKSVLPRSELHLRDFDRVTVNDGQFPDLNASINYVYVPFNGIGVKSLSVDWRKKHPGDKLHYNVALISAYHNTPDESGHEEISQGHPDFENLPYVSNRIDPSLLETIRAIDRKHALGLLKKPGKNGADILVLDKNDAWLVKRIVHGQCSQDRTITVVKIDKSTKKPEFPARTENLQGGECPD